METQAIIIYSDMAIDFKVKKVLCETFKVVETIAQLEQLWIESCLKSVGVPQIMMDQKTSGAIDNKYWREYLILNFKLNIYKQLHRNKVEIHRINENTGASILIGEWSNPELVKVKKGNTIHCELILKYWQLV